MDHIILNTDWEIIGIDSFRHKGISERITHSVHYQKNKKRITIHTHDLTTPLSTILKEQIGNINYIVNFASESHVDRSITDPVQFIENNIKLVLNILEYARTIQHLETFIQISTDEVYGCALGKQNHKEWVTIIPSNPYSASKASQEAIAISYWRTYNIPLIITNTMNNIGERQDPEKFVPMCIRKINAGEKITIHGEPGKIGSRYYLHARNHADALLFLLKNHKTSLYQHGQNYIQKPDRYNIVGEKELNNLELAQMIATILKKELFYELVNFHATRPGHDLRYALDGKKIKRLKWKPPFTFKKSLKKTIRWTLEHPEWLHL